MPGRFPLVPVALTNDPFCTDGFCGEQVTVSVPVTVIVSTQQFNTLTMGSCGTPNVLTTTSGTSSLSPITFTNVIEFAVGAPIPLDEHPCFQPRQISIQASTLILTLLDGSTATFGGIITTAGGGAYIESLSLALTSETWTITQDNGTPILVPPLT